MPDVTPEEMRKLAKALRDELLPENFSHFTLIELGTRAADIIDWNARNLAQASPSEMVELAEQGVALFANLRDFYPTLEIARDFVERVTVVLSRAARQLSPRTGTPEREGLYLVLFSIDGAPPDRELEVFQGGRWLQGGDSILAWWPLPPLPPAADGAKEENSDKR